MDLFFCEGECGGCALVDKNGEPKSDPNVPSVMWTSCNNEKEGEKKQDSDRDLENIFLFIMSHECHPDVCHHACMPWKHQVSAMYISASQSQKTF